MRFLLELCGLAGFASGGWAVCNGGLWGGVLAVTFVVAAAAVWGMFRVRHDPPGKTEQPVVVPGWVRFVIELAFFVWPRRAVARVESRTASETLMTAVVILYGVTWDRQRWLLRQ